MRFGKQAILVLGCVLFAGLWLTAQGPNNDIENVKATMKALTAAYSNAEVDKIAGFYAEDAMYLIPDMEVLKGRAAIKAYLSGMAGRTAEFKQEPVLLKVEGDLAYAVTNQVVTVREKGKPDRVVPNKFFHLWKKQKDGTWKLLIDAVSSRPAKS